MAGFFAVRVGRIRKQEKARLSAGFFFAERLLSADDQSSTLPQAGCIA